MTSYLNFTENKREVRISVQSRRLPLDRRLRMAVPRILTAALSQFTRRLQAIHVWLEDVNGPRGGVDTRCRMELLLRPRGKIVVSALATNEYVAVAEAASRAKAIIGSRVKRARTLRRRVVGS
jgi:hypothetical protein